MRVAIDRIQLVAVRVPVRGVRCVHRRRELTCMRICRQTRHQALELSPPPWLTLPVAVCDTPLLCTVLEWMAAQTTLLTASGQWQV